MNVTAKPDVLLENKVDAIYDNFIRNQVLQGLEDKNISVTCIAKGGNPAPNVEITVNSTTLDDIDLAGERNTSVKESDNTYTGKYQSAMIGWRRLGDYYVLRYERQY